MKLIANTLPRRQEAWKVIEHGEDIDQPFPRRHLLREIGHQFIDFRDFVLITPRHTLPICQSENQARREAVKNLAKVIRVQEIMQDLSSLNILQIAVPLRNAWVEEFCLDAMLGSPFHAIWKKDYPQSLGDALPCNNRSRARAVYGTAFV